HVVEDAFRTYPQFDGLWLRSAFSVAYQGQVTDRRRRNRVREVIVCVIIRFDTAVAVVGADAIPVFAGAIPTFSPIKKIVAYLCSSVVDYQVAGVDRTAEPFHAVIRPFVDLHILDGGALSHPEKRQSIEFL